VRYRFKGIVRTTGQTVQGHAHGESPEQAYQALSEHGIVTENLVEDPEPLNLNAQAQPFGSAIDSALDTAASQVPFDALADRFKGKNVWVLDRDKIRRGVSQVVDRALREAMEGAATGNLNTQDVRNQVADAISGLFKDNRNLTSQVSDNAMKMEHQVRRIESLVHRAESVLAQMTVAIGRMGSGGWGGGGGGPRRFASKGGGGSEQNTVLLEIFKENLRLRGIEIDESPPEGEAAGPEAGGDAGGAAAGTGGGEMAGAAASASESSAAENSQPAPERPERPFSPLSATSNDFGGGGPEIEHTTGSHSLGESEPFERNE
jgi:hypothetical protein